MLPYIQLGGEVIFYGDAITESRHGSGFRYRKSLFLIYDQEVLNVWTQTPFHHEMVDRSRAKKKHFFYADHSSLRKLPSFFGFITVNLTTSAARIQTPFALSKLQVIGQLERSCCQHGIWEQNLAMYLTKSKQGNRGGSMKRGRRPSILAKEFFVRWSTVVS